ncbi:MAG TPA: hypothetical protein VMT34_05490 [Aggregatilineales bacterium]|nr:hypothetical protein [Aggregatilineales bacterium]
MLHPIKWQRIGLIATLVGMVAAVLLVPITSVTAQTTSTPTTVFATVTPVASQAAAPAAAVGAGGVAVETPTLQANETPVPREIQAFRLARTVLSKKIGRHLTYVAAWTWSLDLFHDSALGCPGPNDVVTKGDAAGYTITITTLGQVYELHVTYDLTKVYPCATVGSTGSSSSLPAPAAGSALSGAFEVGGQIQDFNAGTVTHMRAAGMKWVKIQLAPGAGNGAAAISAAHGQNFKILISLKGSASDISAGGYFDTFANYAKTLAAAGADAIEVWNEQNIDREWPTGQVDPANYVQLLAKAYNAIKNGNGNTIVISGALAPTGYWGGSGGKSPNGWDDDVYYQGMASAGAGQYADCIGVHYNEGIVSPQQSSGDPRDNYPTRYFGPMLNRALGPFGGKSACFTELGYVSPEGYGPLPGGFAWGQNTTVAQQAQWLAQAATLSAQSGRVRLMIVFNVDFTFYGADPQAGYAIIRPGGGCPACDALAAVLH